MGGVGGGGFTKRFVGGIGRIVNIGLESVVPNKVGGAEFK